MENMSKHVKGSELRRDRQHGKSWLTNLVVFYNGVSASVDKGIAADVIYLDFCDAFDTVAHSVLLSKLERYRFDGCTLRWIGNRLHGGA